MYIYICIHHTYRCEESISLVILNYHMNLGSIKDFCALHTNIELLFESPKPKWSDLSQLNIPELINLPLCPERESQQQPISPFLFPLPPWGRTTVLGPAPQRVRMANTRFLTETILSYSYLHPMNNSGTTTQPPLAQPYFRLSYSLNVLPFSKLMGKKKPDESGSKSKARWERKSPLLNTLS